MTFGGVSGRTDSGPRRAAGRPAGAPTAAGRPCLLIVVLLFVATGNCASRAATREAGPRREVGTANAGLATRTQPDTTQRLSLSPLMNRSSSASVETCRCPTRSMKRRCSSSRRSGSAVQKGAVVEAGLTAVVAAGASARARRQVSATAAAQSAQRRLGPPATGVRAAAD